MGFQIGKKIRWERSLLRKWEGRLQRVVNVFHIRLRIGKGFENPIL